MTAANPHRGEAALGERHKIVVDFNGFCALEGVMGKTTSELLVMMRLGVSFGLAELRTCIRVFLDTEMTDNEVGDLIASLGMIDVPVPKELRKRGDPDTARQWLAADALGKAVEMFLDPMREEQKANPLKAA